MDVFLPVLMKHPHERPKRLADATAEIVKTSEFRQRMESLGAEPLAISSDQFKALYNADRERWHDLIDANHLKLE